MGLRLQRHLGTVDNLIAGQFCVDHLRNSPDRSCAVYVCCSQCGGIDELGPGHTIEHDGKVVPAWSCPTATCGFLEFVHLESWGVVT